MQTPIELNVVRDCNSIPIYVNCLLIVKLATIPMAIDMKSGLLKSGKNAFGYQQKKTDDEQLHAYPLFNA